MTRSDLLCDMLDNQRRLTKWYLKRIPEGQLRQQIKCEGAFLNAPLWIIAHLIWTDYNIGLLPLGYKAEDIPEWVNTVGFGSSGELPEKLPDYQILMEIFNALHDEKLAFLRTLDDAILDGSYAISSLGFRSNYYALLHLARHEGVHCGGLASFCKLKGIKTV